MILPILIGLIGGWLFSIWLNRQAYDELKAGRKWFLAIIWACALALIMLIIYFRQDEGFETVAGGLIFVGTIAFSSYLKSKQG